MLVFLAAPGWSFFGRSWDAVDTFVAARVVGLSVAADLLLAELLLVVGHLTVGWFLAGLAVVSLAASLGRLVRTARQRPTAEVST
jgi:hypothetical protein